MLKAIKSLSPSIGLKAILFLGRGSYAFDIFYLTKKIRKLPFVSEKAKEKTTENDRKPPM